MAAPNGRPRAIARVPENKRAKVLELARKGRPLELIADVLGISRDTLHAARARARETLARQEAGGGAGESGVNRTCATPGNRTRSGPTQTAYVRPGEVARLLRVAVKTVSRWCDQGRIAGAVRTAGDHWRIPRSEYDRLRAGRASPIA